MLRIAIVGAGAIGAVHAEACRRLPDVAVTWVADQDAGRAEALAGPIGARATTDNAAAVGADDVDAVLIATPTPFHRPATELAAAHGKHVFCEKPIARTVADGEAMIAACRQAGVRLMVGHVVRFYPEYVRIHQLLHEGAIGQVGVVRASRVNAPPQAQRAWYRDLEGSGGLIVDMMIHDLDTLRWYFGEVERVYAHGLSYGPHAEKVDHAVALLRFANGVIAHVEASWAHASFRTALEISGEHGTIRHDGAATAALTLERPTPRTPQERGIAQSGPLAESPYQTELRHFADRVRSGESFLVEGEEAVRSLAVAVAALESVRTGRPVHLADGREQPQESPR